MTEQVQKALSLIVQIDDAANALETTYEDFMKPVCGGIYIKGSESPAMETGKYYYRIDRTAPGVLTEVQILGMNDIVGNVYNEFGEIVICEQIAKNKAKMLLHAPNIPIRGREIARAYVLDILDHVQLYKTKNVRSEKVELRHTLDVFSALFLDSYVGPMTLRQYEDVVVDLLNDLKYTILQVTTTKTWDMLIPSFNGDTITIENHGDFRIHDWEQKLGKQYRLGKG